MLNELEKDKNESSRFLSDLYSLKTTRQGDSSLSLAVHVKHAYTLVLYSTKNALTRFVLPVYRFLVQGGASQTSV